MKNRNSGKTPVLVFVIILIALLLLFGKGSAAGLFGRVLGFLAVSALVILLVLTVVATVYAVNAGKKDYDKRNGIPEKKKKAAEEKKTEDEKPVVPEEKEEPEEVKAARAEMVEIDKLIARTIDVEVKAKATGARCSAIRVLDTLSEQPDELARNRQLFAYYIPTFREILTKYNVIELGGVEVDSAKQKAISSCIKLKGVFETMYQNLYNNEALDLSVEEKALDSIIKKDGLDGNQ